MRWRLSDGSWGGTLLSLTVVALLLIPGVTLASDGDFTQLPNVPANPSSGEKTESSGDFKSSPPLENTEDTTSSGQNSGDSDTAETSELPSAPTDAPEISASSTGPNLVQTGAYESGLFAMLLVGSGGLLLSFGIEKHTGTAV